MSDFVANSDEALTSGHRLRRLQRFRANRPLWIALIPFLFCAILGVRTSRFWNQQDSNAYQALIENIEDQGTPTDQAGYAAWYREHTSSQGTADCLDALAIAAAEIAFDPKIPWVGSASSRGNQEFDRETWAEEPQAADFLQRMRPLIDFIETNLASHPAPIRVPIRWTGTNTTLEAFQLHRTISRILALDVEHALYHRDAERALRGLREMRTTTKAFDSNCFMIGSLISMACEGTERTMIRRSMATDLWSEDQLASFASTLSEQAEFNAPWKQAVQSETIFMIEALKSLKSGDESALDLHTLERFPPVGRWFLEDSTSKAKLVDFYVKCSQASDLGIEGLQARLEKLTSATYPKSSEFVEPLARLLCASFDGFGRAWENREDERRFTLTAVAIKLYQKKFQRWPTTLSQLVEVGLDREDWTTTIEEPFGYMLDEDSVVVWTHPSDSNHYSVRPSVPKTFEDALYESPNDKSEKVATYYVRIR